MQQVALNLPNIWPKIASFYQKLLSNFDLLFGSLKRPKVVEMQQSCMLWQPWAGPECRADRREAAGHDVIVS